MALDTKYNEYFCVGSIDDEKFNIIIGSIEDMLMTDEFLRLQNTFLEKYWEQFDFDEENKLIYTDIFLKYQTTIEKFIQDHLRIALPWFNMDDFIKDLLTRDKKDLDGEIFEMLFTFTDFLNFKEMVLDYKSMKEGKTADLSSDISVTKISGIQNS